MTEKLSRLLLIGALCGAPASAQQAGNTQAPPPAPTQAAPQAEAGDGQAAALDALVEALAKQVNANRAFVNSEEFKKLPVSVRREVLMRAADDLIKQQTEEEQARADALAKAAAAKTVAEQKAQDAAARLAALPPCEAPKKPGLLDRLKQRGEWTVQREVNNAGADTSRHTGGTVDATTLPSVGDVVGSPQQAKPCNPNPPSGAGSSANAH